MPRRARLAIAGIVWHVIQRGNNRSACFYAEEDYRFYLNTLKEQAEKHGCVVHAYVLMTNHVHLNRGQTTFILNATDEKEFHYAAKSATGDGRDSLACDPERE